MPLFDNWAASECANEKRFHFGTLRLWGSAGYAIVCILYGQITLHTDIIYIFFGRAFFFALTVLFVVFNRNEEKIVIVKTKKEKPEVKALFAKKEYWLFFVFIFIFCLPINAVNALFPRLLLDKGSTHNTIAMFSSINAFVEIPFFLLLSKLNKRTGSRGLMLIGSIFVVFRLIGFTFADSIPLLMLSYLCVIPYVCFFLPGFIFYSRSIAPKNTEAFTLTSLQGIAMGFSGMLGNYVGGLIIDSKGIRTMYLYYTIVCITGILLFIITSWWLKNRKNRII
jgi:PPP family 3-phenylpropionic acid transporter